MPAVLAFLGQRRKAIGYIVSAAAELIVQAVPQTNPQNALLLHSVIAVLGLIVVHGVPNDPKPSPADELDALIHGDAAVPAVAAQPAPALPSVADAANVLEDLSGKHVA